MVYTQAQWLLFFFFYCFAGWIWESLYVSGRKRKWVNRGFLYGPLLPIYGFGAILVLWITLPVRNSLGLIFLFGMIGATVLEYITGAVMERLFHVRYWDYSNQKCNIHGYICLTSSLAWGAFSVLLVKCLHLPIEDAVLQIPGHTASLLSMALVIAFTIDATKSVQSALDVRELLREISENNTLIASFEEKFENAAETFSESSEKFRLRIQEIEAETLEHKNLLRQSSELRGKSVHAFLPERFDERKNRKAHFLTLLKEKTDIFLSEIGELLESETSVSEHEKLSRYQKDFAEFRASLERIEISVKGRKPKDFKKAASIIRRNPTATSTRFKDSFRELKQFYSFRNKDEEK